MSENADKEPTSFAGRVTASFAGEKYDLLAESFETTWGFKSTSGKFFKISNRDLAKALSDIVDSWEVWAKLRLHVNSDNPDETLVRFSRGHFSEGAHKDLAEVQRRGFLHLLNAIAYASRHDGAYSSGKWSRPLTKEDYEAALEIVKDFSEKAREFSGRSGKQAPALSSTSTRVTGGENRLFYGAPGTGKSYEVWRQIDRDADPHFVTVFHPDMQNSDFIGTLKPGSDDEGNVGYAFRPGPFARAVACAWANPAKKVYLVIEELNRAVAAAVFGELFQLLDRNPDGSSCYDVDFPSPEFEQWYHEKANPDAGRLSLPPNLWILATMNSADQGVYPLDTAFRRRWRQIYLPIDYSKAPDTTLRYGTPSGEASTGWRQFVRALNNFLVSNLEVGEDRLVGPRFVDDRDLKDGTVPGKLLIYLWDDLLRHHGRADLFDGSIKTYGELDKRSTLRERIFSDKFLATIGGNTPEAGVAHYEAGA
ncbi:MAG: McrB family protein [Erythrobacter sp.]